jgi:hypothetical protein
MNYIKHPTCNGEFGAPHDWDHERHGSCGSLPVQVMNEHRLGPVIRSFWVPTEAELQILKNGGSVMLEICGHGMPPVSMHVALPVISLIKLDNPIIEKLQPVQYQIIEEIVTSLNSLGACVGLLAAISSWGDTLPEQDVLLMLKELNQMDIK